MNSPDLSKLSIDRSGRAAFASRGRPGLKRFLAPGAIAFVLLAAGGFGFMRWSHAPVEVEVASVTMAYPSQAYTVLNATGYVVAQRKAAVASKATGRLIWLGVQEGSRVRKDEVIARLEDLDVRATREQAAASVMVAKANLEQGFAELREAQTAVKRSQDLLRQGFVSQAANDAAIARLDKAKATISSLEASIAAAQANLRGADVSVDQTLIRAPFDGVVLTKSANIGDVITPFSSALDSKGAVVSIADMSTLEVEADVSESSLFKVSPGQAVEIQLDALPEQRFRGVVARTVPTVDRSKATVMTKIRFVEPDDRVLPEMSARVSFLSQEVPESDRKPRPAVNPGAVVIRDGRNVMFVIRADKAAQVQVQTGAKLGDLVEVLGGARPGDKVVLRPPEKLRDGASVKAAVK